MDRKQALELARRYNRADACHPANIALLQGLSLAEREEFAFHSQTVVLYLGDEVRAVSRAEEEAALAAAPQGYSVDILNGLNVGCGDRIVSPLLQQVDIMRAPASVSGEHNQFLPNALLATPDDLPFKSSSIDFIISLHALEHMTDPAAVVLHWLDIIKPGGGVGVVVPDWRYTWDARTDLSLYGHKWNPTSEAVEEMYETHWHQHATLESIHTYPYRLSFDFVLRKHGTFEPFRPPHQRGLVSGSDLHRGTKSPISAEPA